MTMTDLKISFRIMLREKQYAIINVIGLAAAMAGALLILLFLQFELSYDKYHPDHERIFRLASSSVISGEEQQFAVNSYPLAPLMVEQFPDFTEYARVFPVNFFFRNLVYRHQDKNYFESGVFAADSTIFDFFHFDFLHGTPGDALNKPFTLVMTQSMSERYFGDHDPIGESILVEGAGHFEVTAVIEDPPVNSHFQFEGLLSMSSLAHLNPLFESVFGRGANWAMFENSLTSKNVWVYIKTVEGFNPDHFMKNHWDPFYDDHLSGIESTLDMRSGIIFQPVSSIHMGSKLLYEMTSETGATTMMSPEMVGVFLIIVLFLLTIAAINYTNLAISRFKKRGKEVGVRKVMGAGKLQLIRQFMLESMLTTVLALLIALLMAEMMLPAVNNLLGVAITANVFQNPYVLFVLLGMAVFVGIVAGIYPSVYYTSFSPKEVLVNRYKPGRKTLSLKKSLIVLQFIISIFMVVATLVVHNQMRYINQKDLGYDYDHVLIVEMQDDSNKNRAEVLMNTLLQEPLIIDAAVSNYYPSIYTLQNTLNIDTDEGQERFALNFVQVSADFKEFMDMELVKGRFFDWESRTDIQEAVIINESTWRQIGWEDPLGKMIHINYEVVEPSETGRRVIGVMKDFHYTSLTNPIEPMLIFPMENRGSFLMVKLPGSNLSAGIAAVESAWNEFAPMNPFEYFFLDQTIAGMYQSQQVLGRFFGAFAIVCIIISFMGVYGLSAYAAEQRTREIGIRKVLGASMRDVLLMLAKDFLWLLAIAFGLASILAWYAMGQWLDGFAYSVRMELWPFLVAGLTAFLITFFAVGYHARRSMRRNPSETLQYE